jgi:hypothetical protein
MPVVGATEDPADPVGELVSTEQPLGLRDLAFGVDPLGLYGVQPRTLDGQRARYYETLSRLLVAAPQPTIKWKRRARADRRQSNASFIALAVYVLMLGIQWE